MIICVKSKVLKRTHVKTGYSIQDEPYTKIEFEDGQLITFKAEKLEFDYMAYIIIRELAERKMIASSAEDIKV